MCLYICVWYGDIDYDNIISYYDINIYNRLLFNTYDNHNMIIITIMITYMKNVYTCEMCDKAWNKKGEWKYKTVKR